MSSASTSTPSTLRPKSTVQRQTHGKHRHARHTAQGKTLRGIRQAARTCTPGLLLYCTQASTPQVPRSLRTAAHQTPHCSACALLANAGRACRKSHAHSPLDALHGQRTRRRGSRHPTGDTHTQTGDKVSRDLALLAGLPLQPVLVSPRRLAAS